METAIGRIFEIPHYQKTHCPKEDALASKVDGRWVKYSIEQVIDISNRLSRGLIAMGINRGDKIAVISSTNRPEWHILDFAILQIGAVNVPIYPTISENDYLYIFNHAEVKLCFVSDKDLLKKVCNIMTKAPSLKNIFTFDRIEGATFWETILDKANSIKEDEVERRKSQVKEEDLATIIYTSGTTGVPKGVMISHKNIVSNVIACMPRLPIGTYGRALSFLPVCHVFERVIIYLYMYRAISVYFAENMEAIGDNLREAKPHVFTTVPRMLEKVFDKIMAKGAALSGIKRALFFWALKLGERYEPYGANGWWYEFRLNIARKLIFSKWCEALGGNVEVVACGSAALQPRLAKVFNAAGVPVMEGYGLTETAVVVSVNMVEGGNLKFGTTGKPIKDVQVKIASDGEILIKSPSVMMGYYKQPDLTKEVIDSEGWLHTGDIGEMINGEFLKITDRKKEMFKTSGGKYIAPQPMENKFKESPYIEQIMVIGENRKHPSALIVPAFMHLNEWCKSNGVAVSDNEALIRHEKVINLIHKEVEKYNKGFAHFEQIKKFELLPAEWSVDKGELTPTLKLKRKVIMGRYSGLVEELYKE